jgi:outer membrane protein TolC
MNRIIITGFLLLGILKVEAQGVLTLEEAINIALKNSLDIRISRNNLEANILNNHISIAGGLPQVNGSLNNNQALTNLNQKLSNGTNIERNGNATSTNNASISGSLLLFNGFRVHATKNRLEALELQSEQQINVQVQNVIANVMVKYYDIVRQDSYIKTIRQSIEVTLQRKKLVDARQSVGLANNADTYQAQIDLNASEQELQSQELVLSQAKADLMNLLTQRADSVYAIRDTIIVDSLINLNTVMDNLTKNPDVLAAEQQIRINEAIVREVGAQRYPSVALNGGYNYNRNQSTAGFTLLNQTYGPFIGLGLQVPLFNGGANKRQQRVAEIGTRNSTLTRQALLNDLQTSAIRAWQAYQNNLARLQTERENNRIAADLLSLVLQRFQFGVGTIVDVREAQRSFVEAGYRLVNLAYAAKVSEVELKRLASQLGI